MAWIRPAGVLGECLADGVVFHHLFILLGRDYLPQSAVELGIGRRVHDIPHFGFSALLALTMRYFVGRVHLYAQVLACVDELDKQRKLVAETAFAQQTDQLVEAFSGHGAVGHLSLVVFHT